MFSGTTMAFGEGVTRRGLLGRAGLLAASTALPVSLPVRGARAEVMTALMVANTAMGLLRSFSGSSDGGLGAMLRAQAQKLDLLSEQVAQVQQELGKVAAAVGQLPAAFQEQLTNQSIMEQINDIQACAAAWREITKRPSYRAEGRLARTDASDLEDVRKKARHARFVLSASEMGERPLAATAGMVALALDVSLEARLRGTDAGLKESLDTYLDWFARIQDGNRPSSAATAYRLLSEQVATAVRAAFQTRPMAGSTLDAALTGDSPPAEWAFRSSTAHCYREYRSAVSIPGRPCLHCNGEIGGHYSPAAFGHAPTVHHAWEVSYTVQDGVRMWRVREATVPRRQSVPQRGWRPTYQLAACRPPNVEAPFSRTLEQAQQNALAQAPIIASERNLRALAEQIATLNILEARKVFVARSLQMARDAQLRAQAWRSELA